MKRKYTPSLWWIALAPLFLVVGVGGGTTLLLREVLHRGTEITFKAPVSRTIAIDDPGTYILSHDYRIMYRGKKYEEDPALPESAQITLMGPDGAITMEKSWGSGSTSEEHSRIEIGRFEIPAPGDYALTVANLPSPRVMTLSESVIVQIIMSAIASILLSLLGWFGAPAVVIVVVAKRIRNKRRFRAEHPELAEPEETLRE